MEMELITAQIARLSLKPDDTLVVRCKGRIMRETADRVAAEVRALTLHQKVLVCGDDVEFTVLEAA